MQARKAAEIIPAQSDMDPQQLRILEQHDVPEGERGRHHDRERHPPCDLPEVLDILVHAIQRDKGNCAERNSNGALHERGNYQALPNIQWH